MTDVTAGDPDHSTHLAKLKELGAKTVGKILLPDPAPIAA